MKIVDYIICHQEYDETIDDLESKVQDNISYGFQPLGAPILDKSGHLYQAMVKYEEEGAKVCSYLCSY